MFLRVATGSPSGHRKCRAQGGKRRKNDRKLKLESLEKRQLLAGDAMDGLVAHWNLDGDARDSALYGRTADHGASVGDVKFVQDAQRGTVAKFGQGGAIQFDHSRDVNRTTVRERSLRVSFKTENVHDRQVLFEEGGRRKGMNLYVESGEIHFGMWGMEGAEDVTLDTKVKANRWLEAVVTIEPGASSSTEISLYVNGGLSDTGKGGALLRHGKATLGNAGNVTVIAGERISTASGFQGMIDDVQIYDRALSVAEIRSLGKDANHESSNHESSSLIRTWSHSVDDIPYDASREDQKVLGAFASRNQIEVHANTDGTLSAVWQSDDSIHVVRYGHDDSVASEFSVRKGGYDKFVGSTVDPKGNHYIVLGRKIEQSTRSKSKNLLLLKFNAQGRELGRSGLSTLETGWMKMVNPGSQGSVLYADGQVAVQVGGTRLNGHQGGMFRVFDAETLRHLPELDADNIASHYMDGALAHDQTEFVSIGLGDDSPTGIAILRNAARPRFFVPDTKGNQTHTKLASNLIITDTEYIVGFSTSPSKGHLGKHDNRNFAISKVSRQEVSELDELSAFKARKVRQETKRKSFKELNRNVVQVTNYSKDHVARPKLVQLSDGRMVAMWERWSAVGGQAKLQYKATEYAILDTDGNVLQGGIRDLGQVRLNDQDHPIAMGNKVVWVTGNSADRELNVHVFDVPTSK